MMCEAAGVMPAATTVGGTNCGGPLPTWYRPASSSWCQAANTSPAAFSSVSTPNWLRLFPTIFAATTARAQLRRGADEDLAGERLIRRLPDPRAGFEIIVHGLAERGDQPVDSVGMKADPVLDAGDMADEDGILGVNSGTRYQFVLIPNAISSLRLPAQRPLARLAQPGHSFDDDRVDEARVHLVIFGAQDVAELADARQRDVGRDRRHALGPELDHRFRHPLDAAFHGVDPHALRGEIVAAEPSDIARRIVDILDDIAQPARLVARRHEHGPGLSVPENPVCEPAH